MPSAYQLFVKKHMLAMSDSDMKATDKMKHIAKLWHKTKDTHNHSIEDSSEDSSSEDEAPRKPRKPVKKSNTKRKTNKDVDLSELLELLRK